MPAGLPQVEQLRGTVTGLTAKLEASGSLSSRAAEVQVLLEKERARSAELSDVGQGAAEKLRAVLPPEGCHLPTTPPPGVDVLTPALPCP